LTLSQTGFIVTKLLANDPLTLTRKRFLEPDPKLIASRISRYAKLSLESPVLPPTQFWKLAHDVLGDEPIVLSGIEASNLVDELEHIGSQWCRNEIGENEIREEFSQLVESIENNQKILEQHRGTLRTTSVAYRLLLTKASLRTAPGLRVADVGPSILR
jgi:hypothetical protein